MMTNLVDIYPSIVQKRASSWKSKATISHSEKVYTSIEVLVIQPKRYMYQKGNLRIIINMDEA